MQNMKAFSGIHHIALKCGDAGEYVKVIDFYRDTLDWRQYAAVAPVMMPDVCSVPEVIS